METWVPQHDDDDELWKKQQEEDDEIVHENEIHEMVQSTHATTQTKKHEKHDARQGIYHDENVQGATTAYSDSSDSVDAPSSYATPHTRWIANVASSL